MRKWIGNPAGSGGHWEEVECSEPLYQEWRGRWIQPERDGFGHLLPLPEVRYPIAEYIKRRYPHLVELSVIDEVHEYKSQSTDRGHAFGTLVRASKRTLAMTGTLFGGFATSLFYLLHRLDPRIRAEFAWRDGQRFATLYGVLERVAQACTERSRSDRDNHRHDDEYGVYSGLRRRHTRMIERPGISPALVTRLQFRILDDKLPNPKSEIILAWPNACWRDEETSVMTVPALPADRLYPKEEWLVEKCRAERERGRRVLVYVRQTATRDIQPRLMQVLGEAGLRVTVLRNSVPTHRREAWVQRQVKAGLGVMICNPRLVQTGLDLIAFHTLLFYEPEYSIYLIRQASRRSWRLGQTEPVEVYFAVYADTNDRHTPLNLAGTVQLTLF